MDFSRIARPCILRREAYYPGKPLEEVRRIAGDNPLTVLSANENGLGTSPRALDAMIRALQGGAKFAVASGLCAFGHLRPRGVAGEHRHGSPLTQ